MNISAKTEYACLAMLELALRYSSQEPVRLRDIAAAHGIPSPFLVQIFQQLKSAGLVESTRGSAGGYRLLSAPRDISLGEVMSLIDRSSLERAAPNGDSTVAAQVLAEKWREVDAVQRELLANVTLAQLVERVRGRTEEMYYI